MSTELIVLRAPSANRVYTAAAGELCRAEAHWVLGARGLTAEVEETTVGGMEALGVRVDGEDADDALVDLLGSLSCAHGVLERSGIAADGRELLTVRTPQRLERHPSDLETTLKYPGKTNEQFTAMLVNLAAALTSRPEALADGSLTLLDPMCGRGTTLNRALRLGLSPLGGEIDRKAVEAYGVFLTTWLRTHRYKHQVRTGRTRVRGEQLGPRIDAEFAADKQTQKAGGGQSITVFGCDTLRLGELLGAGTVDAIVTDLPYGVQHGSRSRGGLQRSPLEILEAAAPHWRRMLRQGGAIAVASNRHTLDHGAAGEALSRAGFVLLSRDGAFRHRVDQSIDRDVLLAIPADHPRRDLLQELAAAQPVPARRRGSTPTPPGHDHTATTDPQEPADGADAPSAPTTRSAS